MDDAVDHRGGDGLVAEDAAPAAELVVSRASHARALTSEDEEIGIASDLAYALIVANLPQSLEPGMHWLAGASAVHYRPRVLSAAIAALHVHQALDDALLAPLPAQHTECDEGRQWVVDQSLARASHLDRLSRSPRGSSIQSEIQIDESLFTDVRPELLLDALRSFVQQKADDLVREARIQIERNRAEHLDPVKADLEHRTWDVLRSRVNVARAARFVECVGEELEEVAERVALAIGDAQGTCAAEADEMAAIEEDLAVCLRKLPYPAAVVVRGLGLGALGVWAYLFLQRQFGWDPNFTVLSIVVGLVGVGMVVWGYARARSRIDGLRRRYLRLAERRVRCLVALAVLDAAARSVTELREMAVGARGSLAGQLATLRTSLEELRALCAQRIEDRVLGELSTTDFSVFVPTPEDLSTADLARSLPLPEQFDLPRRLLQQVLADPQGSATQLDEALVTMVHTVLLPQMWPNLSALIADSSSAQDRARNVLGAVMTPLLRVDELVEAHSVHRFATLNTPSALDDLLNRAGVSGRIATSDADSVVHIGVRAVPAATLERKQQ